MNHENPTGEAEPKRRRPRIARLCVGISLLLAAVASLFYVHLTGTDRIRAAVEGLVRRSLGGEVSIDSVTFSWFGGIQFRGVTMTLPPHEAAPAALSPDPHTEGPGFFCREIFLDTMTVRALVGALSIRAITLRQPVLTMVLDSRRGGPSGAWLDQLSTVVKRIPGEVLPLLDASDAGVRILEKTDSGVREIENLRFDLRGRPLVDKGRSHFDLVWSEARTTSESGHLRMNLRSGEMSSVRGGLPWVSMPLARILSEGSMPQDAFGVALHELGGRIRVSDFRLGGGNPPASSSFAVFELQDASLTIPWPEGESGDSPVDAFLRFSQFGGTIRWQPDQFGGHLRGLFRGAAVELTASAQPDGSPTRPLSEWTMQASLSVQGAILPRIGEEAPPEEARLVSRWRPLEVLYRDYDPHGPVDLDLTIVKASGPDQPFTIREAKVTARGADASCRYAPYRVADLSGAIKFNSQGFFLKELCGRHGASRVCAEGWFAEMSLCSPVELRITGERLTIDDDLYQATPPLYRKIRPLFSPTGATDVAVTLNRPQCEGAQPAAWRSQYEVALQDVTAAYVEVPLPCRNISGTVSVDEEKTVTISLNGRTGDAPIRAEGRLRHDAEGLRELDLHLAADRVVLSDALLSALPDAFETRIRPFRPNGTIDIASHLTLKPGTERIQADSTFTLQGIAVQHEAYPLPVVNLRGPLMMNPERITFQEISGNYESSVVRVEGYVPVAEGPAELKITAADLIWDKRIQSLLPERAAEVIEEWSINGPIFVESVYHRDPNDTIRKLPTWETTARLSQVSIGHPSLPRPVEDVQAEVRLNDPAGWSMDLLSARYGTGRLVGALNGSTSSSSEGWSVTLSAEQLTLDESLHGLIPPSLRSWWQLVNPQGRVDLRLDRLECDSRPQGDRRKFWSVRGHLKLNEVSLDTGLPVRNLSGVIDGRGEWNEDGDGASLSGTFQTESLELGDRKLGPANGRWYFISLPDGSAQITVDPLEGSMYGGTYVARIELRLAENDVDYSVSTLLQQMDIEPWVNDSRRRRSPPQEPIDVSGKADARFQLSGTAGGSDSLRGMGRIDVSQANLYRTPLILAILKVINLTIPGPDAFDDVRAEFFLVGNRMEFTDIELRGKGLALLGSGTMSLPDQNVDLRLYYINPSWWMEIPLLTNLVESAARELVELRVTGPLSQPAVRAQPFRGLTEEIKSLLQKKRPQRIQPR